MRRLSLFLIVFFISELGFGQDISFGAFAGLNNTTIPMIYKKGPYGNVTQSGFSIGGVGDIRFAKFLSFQPGLYFTRKGGSTNNDTVEISTGIPRFVGKTKMYLDYGEIPLNLIFNAKVAGATFFAGGGPYFALKFGTLLKINDGDNGAYEGSPDFPPKLNDADLGYDLIGGIRFVKGFTIRISYEKSLGTVYDGQPGVKNQGFNFSAGYFFK